MKVDVAAQPSRGGLTAPKPLFVTLRDALKNVKLTQTLVDVITEAGATGGCPKPQGNLLVVVATKVGTCGLCAAAGVLPAATVAVAGGALVSG